MKRDRVFDRYVTFANGFWAILPSTFDQYSTFVVDVTVGAGTGHDDVCSRSSVDVLIRNIRINCAKSVRPNATGQNGIIES